MRPIRAVVSPSWVRVVLALACCGVGAGCASRAGSAPTAAANPAAKPLGSGAVEHPMIVRLVSRRYSVVISAGCPTPVYTIRDAAGSVLAGNVTLDQLRDTRVDLYDQLAPLICPGNAASAASVQWAGE